MPNRPAQYDIVSKWLHWTAAALLIIGFLVAESTSHRFADGAGYGVHAVAGLALLVLTGLRIFWRMTHAAPAYPATMAPAEKWLANCVKVMFYVLMTFIPLSGLAVHAEQFLGRGLIFGFLALPDVPGWLVPGDAGALHELTAHLWLPLLAMHAAAAVWHHYVRRDDVLTRMLRQRRR